jgi:C4-dicarboxylate transporter DctQ subunit
VRLGRRLLALADRLEEAFMVGALVFITLLTFVQVVLRYGFRSGFVWSLEATTYVFAWLVLIGMSYGVRTQAHLAVDLLTSRLAPRQTRIVGMFALACGLAYCALMIFGSASFVDRLITLGTDARDIPLPRWLLTSVMPVAFALLALRLVQAASAALRGADGQR